MNECQIVDEDGYARCTCDTDAVFRLLADARRRKLIAALESCEDDQLPLSKLIRQSTTDEQVDLEARKREFHHVHLPMLDDHGLIDYDSEADLIRYYHCELVADVLAMTDL
ncbi:hypothetical protein DV706_02235 [Natronorubrum bangense]|uniref:DUF7344 domain-containing protein n=2 Tax=Natronorubrum bangense TaxID=61858 RepID=L9WCD8_9EURY|nr:hypothetical protein C494_13196 [Natronorubrum bangense JCM 10635]QCC53404.1 hypothetical protein DV706_02235 [Natronorubrum bangense]